MALTIPNHLLRFGDSLKKSYVHFITQNPSIISEIESTLKASLYIFEAFSTNYETSIFVTELVTSICNLISFTNSCILSTAKRKIPANKAPLLTQKIKQALVVLDFTQTFFEVIALRVGGLRLRWFTLWGVCLIKAILKLILLFVHDDGICTTTGYALNPSMRSEAQQESPNGNAQVFYVGKRSGHVMRTLDGACGTSNDSSFPITDMKPTQLSSSERIGETLHCLRPLLHLSSCQLFGSKSWIPWFTALLADTSSHVLLQRQTNTTSSSSRKQSTVDKPYNQVEKEELRRRYRNMALYLLRSPLYEKHTGPTIQKICDKLSENVPLVRFVLRPLSAYLPEWQKIYFYNWAD